MTEVIKTLKHLQVPLTFMHISYLTVTIFKQSLQFFSSTKVRHRSPLYVLTSAAQRAAPNLCVCRSACHDSPFLVHLEKQADVVLGAAKEGAVRASVHESSASSRRLRCVVWFVKGSQPRRRSCGEGEKKGKATAGNPRSVERNPVRIVAIWVIIAALSKCRDVRPSI